MSAATITGPRRLWRPAPRPDARIATAGPPAGTVLKLLALYACWGSSVPAMKLMVETMPPAAAAGGVFVVGGLVLGLLSLRAERPTAPQVRRAALSGVLLLGGGQGLATLALTQVTASLTAVLAAAIPLWIAVLSRGDGTSWPRVLAGFAGIAVMSLTAPQAAIGGSGLALAACIVAPVLWAAGSITGSRGDRMPGDPRAGGAVQLLAGGAVMLVLAGLTGELSPSAWDHVSAGSLGAAGFLLVADSLAGFLLYTQLLRTAPLPLVSTYSYTTPVIAAAVGVVALHEPLWAGALLGGAIVLAAVALEVRARTR